MIVYLPSAFCFPSKNFYDVGFILDLLLANGFLEALKPVCAAVKQTWRRRCRGDDHISSPTQATMSNARERMGCVSTMDTRWYTLEGLPGAMSAVR